jgi:hypothetical protein
VSHEDKAFFSSFIGVLVVLVVIAFAFYFIADFVTSDMDTGGRLRQARIEANIKPVGQVNVGSAPAASGEAAETVAAGPRSGDQLPMLRKWVTRPPGLHASPKGLIVCWLRLSAVSMPCPPKVLARIVLTRS